MISKGKLKYIKSLQVKKYRNQEQCFVVEGAKGVLELLRSDFEITLVLATDDFADRHDSELRRSTADIEIVKRSELEQVGTFQSNDSVLAVARMRDNRQPSLKANEFALVLDDIRDPGNLGTMIRTADWYGIQNIIASEETADVYNPKVISASMGSFTRVNIYYCPLEAFLSESKRTVYGAFLDGQNVHLTSFDNGGLILIGNESGGITPVLAKFVTQRITIPRVGRAESLNASIATAIILDNAMRTKLS